MFLIDLEERRPISHWRYGENGGWTDAGGVAMAPDFGIYIADTRNDVVRRFSPFGREVGRLGLPAERAPGAAARDRAGVLDRPRGVAVHDGVVYVACGERELVRGVQRLRPDGAVLKPLRAFGDGERHFGAPRGVWAGPSGVLVADTLHGVVQRFTIAGDYVGHFATATRAAEASRPVAVAVLAAGDVLVADQGDSRGLKRFAPDGTPRPSPRLDVCLAEPLGLAVDEVGRVYVLDRDGERVQRLRQDLTFDTVIADLAEMVP